MQDDWIRFTFLIAAVKRIWLEWSPHGAHMCFAVIRNTEKLEISKQTSWGGKIRWEDREQSRGLNRLNTEVKLSQLRDVWAHTHTHTHTHIQTHTRVHAWAHAHAHTHVHTHGVTITVNIMWNTKEQSNKTLQHKSSHIKLQSKLRHCVSQLLIWRSQDNLWLQLL